MPLLVDREYGSWWCHTELWKAGWERWHTLSPLSFTVTPASCGVCMRKRAGTAACLKRCGWLASNVSEEACVKFHPPWFVVVVWQGRAGWWMEIGRWQNWGENGYNGTKSTVGEYDTLCFLRQPISAHDQKFFFTPCVSVCDGANLAFLISNV